MVLIAAKRRQQTVVRNALALVSLCKGGRELEGAERKGGDYTYLKVS